MWLYLAPSTHHGNLRRALALGRLAPEPMVILSGSEYSHDAPNCHVAPFSTDALALYGPAASVVLFNVVMFEYQRHSRQKLVFVQRTPNKMLPDKPQVDMLITAGVYEKTQWPGLVTEAWLNPVETPAEAHDVVVVASGMASILPWYIEITRALLAAGLDAILVAPSVVDEVPSVVSTNAQDWVASANVVISTSGITMYEALHLGKSFIGLGLYNEQRVRLEGAIAGGEAVLSGWEPAGMPGLVTEARQLVPKAHDNGAPVALAAIVGIHE
jgi:hypothetical protein